MEVVKAVGALLFWGFILGGLYLKTVESSSQAEPGKLKAKRFMVMIALWLVAPVVGGAVLAGLVAEAAGPEWARVLAVAVAIAVPWVIAIRLQMRWSGTARKSHSSARREH